MTAKEMYMIKSGELVKIQRPVFTTGDAYVVVDESQKKVFIWLGSRCSADEKETAAVNAQKIDGEQYQGKLKIITYDEGQEGGDFLGAVENLKILDKNRAKSMLKDVTTGEFAWQSDHVLALYRVSSEEFKGINTIKYKQVPFQKSSLDSEDCFIADLGVDIWIWQGKEANVKEKVRAMQFARAFDADRAGAQIPRVFMEEEPEEKEFLDIFTKKIPKQDRDMIDLKPERYEKGKQNSSKSGLCTVLFGILLVGLLFFP